VNIIVVLRIKEKLFYPPSPAQNLNLKGKENKHLQMGLAG
jgi:hypothetical protein